MMHSKLPQRTQIQIELVQLLYQQVAFGLWGESLAAIAVFIALWGAVNVDLLIGWLLFNLVVCGLARHLLVYYYRRIARTRQMVYNEMKLWLILFGLGAFCSGISWGMVGSLLIVKNDMVRFTFNVLLLMGVTSVANPLYSPNRSVYMAFLFPAFLPFAIWLAMQGEIFVMLGLLALIYIVIMLATSFYYYKLIFTSLFFRFENIDLVESLSSAKDSLEKRQEELEKTLFLRKAMEERLFHQANFDSLTGLPNRALLLDRSHQVIAFAKASNTHVAFLFLDLDRFKLINDTSGHAFGDKLLIAVANRLLACVGKDNTVSREGGDEFVVLLHVVKTEMDSIGIVSTILHSLREPFVIENHRFNITVSIGISFYPKDGADPEVLIKNADIAMYQAKELGRNNFQFFTEELNKKMVNRLVIENQLRYALEQDEFYLVYQPIVDLHSGRIIKLEALLRWKHPKKVTVLPGEFIAIAEDTGFIIPIGEWVLRTACQCLKELHEKGFPELCVAVNLSPCQLKQGHIVQQIYSILTATQLDPRYLALELTEGSLLDDVDKTIELLYEIKKMGTSLLIDDFGTGYSSLSYLKRLPVDKLKIDRSFIQDIPHHADDSAITAAIIALAGQLNMKVVAEGVENKQQLEFLIAHHCDEIQGYYFSAPLKVEELIDLLHRNQVEPMSV